MLIVLLIWITAIVFLLVGIRVGKRLAEQEYNSRPLEDEKEEDNGNSNSR